MVYHDKTVLSLYFIFGLSSSAYAIIAPFLPFEFEKKGFNQSYIGYIFSIFSVAIVVTSPFIGRLITKYKRRPLLAVGTFCMGMSFICFSVID